MAAGDDLGRAALVAAVNASYHRDPERHRLSYTEHTATALRRRALAAGNGHGAKP